MLATPFLLAVALAQTPQEVAFAWQPKVGTTQTYKMTIAMTMDQGGQAIDLLINMKNTNKVTKVDKETATTDATSSDFSISMNGQDLGAPPDDGTMSQVVTTVFALNGVIKSRTEAGPSSPGLRVQQMNTFIYPGKATIDKPWDYDFKGDTEKKLPVAKARFKILGEERIGKYDCYKVEHIYAEDQPGGFSMMGTAWMDKTDGNLVKADYQYQNVQFVDMMPPANAKVTLERVD